MLTGRGIEPTIISEAPNQLSQNRLSFLLTSNGSQEFLFSIQKLWFWFGKSSLIGRKKNESLQILSDFIIRNFLNPIFQITYSQPIMW